MRSHSVNHHRPRLANLHEACGALVYRVNHINDFGDSASPRGRSPVSGSVSRRHGNNGAARGLSHPPHARTAWSKKRSRSSTLTRATRTARRYFLGRATVNLRTRLPAIRHRWTPGLPRSKRGVKEEVELWQRMVDCSLTDFQRFYDSPISALDLVLGESFISKPATS